MLDDSLIDTNEYFSFIHQMSCEMNRKYSQDIDEVRNNDFYLK